jgi:two-component system cell cycle sensor histidine kinase/response regulator CckA
VARQTEDLRRRNRELSALNRVSYAISNPLDLDNMLHRAVNAAVAAVKADGGAVRLLNPATNQLVIAAACNLPDSFLATSRAIPLGEGIIGQVAQNGHPRGAENFGHDPWLAPLAASAAFRSYLCVPLRTRDEIVGTLGVIMQAEFDVSAHELELLANIGNQIGVAVERLRLSEQTRDQARQVQGIISTVPEGVVLLNADARVLLANPAARKHLTALADAGVGDTLTHLGGRPVAELLTPPPRGLWHEIKLDGPPRQVFEMVARPMEEEAGVGDSVLVIRDVTQEREFQERLQQQDRLAAVGQLAAGIAHDFNNIMAVIVLYSGLLSRTLDLSPKGHEQLKVIARQAKQATKLIQQILDFSRRSILERQPLDLVPPLKEIVKLLQRTLPENIQVALDVAPGAYVVNADPTRMQQVFMNLAVNARDAMPSGGELCIELDRLQVQDGQGAPIQELGTGDWVRIIVRDTGTGIPPDLLSHVFEPFFTTKAPGKGSGLGLAQVYGIVTQHNGYIDVASTLREGTTFTLYLPALPQTGAETPQAQSETPTEGQQETVLVVEDNRATRRALRDALEALNYRALEAEDGRDGLELYERHQDEIALVLTDLVMPEMGGQALIHELRQRNPAVKVVVITGHPLEEEISHLRAKGRVEVVEKPVDLEQLAQVIRRSLNSG